MMVMFIQRYFGTVLRLLHLIGHFDFASGDGICTTSIWCTNLFVRPTSRASHVHGYLYIIIVHVISVYMGCPISAEMHLNH